MIGSIYKMGKLYLIKKKNNKENQEEYLRNAALNWGKYIVKTSGVKIKITGMENIPSGSCLFVGNHQGYLDIPLLLSKIDKNMGFIAKKEMENVPILSYWMKQIHCVFMDRDNPREAIKAINEGVEFLRDGYSMVIFPEGTRSKGGVLGDFKKGSMKLALKSGVPIVPLTFVDTYEAFEEKGRITPVEVKLIIGKQININALSKPEQNNLSETIRDLIKMNLLNS